MRTLVVLLAFPAGMLIEEIKYRWSMRSYRRGRR